MAAHPKRGEMQSICVPGPAAACAASAISAVIDSDVLGLSTRILIPAHIPRRKRIDAPILAPNAKEHQLRIVRELHAEPIPADLLAFQLMREKFVIHPRKPAYSKRLSVERDVTARPETRQRNVV